ncbi:hypothetical protein KJ953_02120 [Patescibacteria group bacterium]|nr:hypothetical protein [Patescibacteria group bacterium]MBU1256506.1 hypothetical protein [Patescibacteria group bacterium]MBU1457390.1 hypothetical protein [Patescibacteria group bacterium]
MSNKHTSQKTTNKTKKKTITKKKDFLSSMAKFKLTSGPKNLSSNIDKYLYQQ